jgi:CAAX protease family protein
MTVKKLPSTDIRIAIFELILILGTLFSVKYFLLRFDAVWTYAGPISLLLSLAVATLCLRANKEGWGTLGLKRPKNIIMTLVLTAIVLVATIGIGGVVESIVASLQQASGETAPAIDERYTNRFANVPGNVAAYIYWVAVGWIVGGFTEELLFRGVLISRFERVFAGAPFAIGIAVILQSIIFGQQHYYYQGISGAMATGAIAMLSGVIYVLLKRNLWPLTLSHGLSNMIGLTLIYTGTMPPV